MKYYNAESYEANRFEDAILKYQVVFFFFKDVFRLLSRPDLLLCVFYSLLVNSINHKYNFHNYILFCSGIGMEDQRVSGVFKSNAEPHHRFGSADRISALCILRDRGEVSGTNSREHLRYQTTARNLWSHHIICGLETNKKGTN